MPVKEMIFMLLAILMLVVLYLQILFIKMSFYSDYLSLVLKIGFCEILVIAALYAICLIVYAITFAARQLKDLIVLTNIWRILKCMRNDK